MVNVTWRVCAQFVLAIFVLGGISAPIMGAERAVNQSASWAFSAVVYTWLLRSTRKDAAK